MVEVHTVFADAHHMPMPTTSTAMIKNSNQQQQQQQLEVICKFAPLAAMKFQREQSSSRQQQPSSSTTTFAANLKSQPSDLDQSGEEESSSPQSKPEAETSSEETEEKRTKNMVSIFIHKITKFLLIQQINFDGHEVIRREKKLSPSAPVIRVRQGMHENSDGNGMSLPSSEEEIHSIEPDEEEHSLFTKASASDQKLVAQQNGNHPPEAAEEASGEKVQKKNFHKNYLKSEKKIK